MKSLISASSLFVVVLFCATMVHAAGGYDHGTPAGKGNLDIDLTLNPGDRIDSGQSYLVWGYGLTDTLDFHGYASHEANGTNQIYYGLMYNFYSNDWLDLSTAAGFRHRSGVTDIFLPQLLYTIKLPQDFELIGSAVSVYNVTDGYNRGVAHDIALRIPVAEKYTPSFVKGAKFSLGAFRGAGKTKWNPTYSLDLQF